jgi:hypothetical protein
LISDGRKHLLSLGTLSGQHPDFNQSMGRQRHIYFLQNGRGSPALTDMNGNVEIVRQTFKRTALDRI